MNFTFNKDFGLVATSVVGIAFECLFIGMIVGGGLRRKLFSDEFMEKHFGEEHWRTFGEKPPKEGYPDTGNGRYSEHLSYADWYAFNNRQRAHYNFLEQVVTVIVLIIVAGIHYALAAGILGWIYFVGRLAYTFGYVARGPKGRLVGVLLCDIGLLGGIVVAIMSCVKMF